MAPRCSWKETFVFYCQTSELTVSFCLCKQKEEMMSLSFIANWTLFVCYSNKSVACKLSLQISSEKTMLDYFISVCFLNLLIELCRLHCL